MNGATRRSHTIATLGAMLFFGAALAIASALPVVPGGEGGIGGPPRPLPEPIETIAPHPIVTPLSPVAPPIAPITGSGTVRTPSPVGRSVPLSMLAPLPPQTARNTVTPQNLHQRLHPMSATAATIVVATTGNCNGSVGTIFIVGCTLQWQGVGLDDPNDTYQDYVVMANSATATAVGGQYVNNNGGSGPIETTTLSASGTYVFGSYDVTRGFWDTVVYLVAGSATYFNTYSDPFLKNPSTNFSDAAGTAVYMSASGLTPTDRYVFYIESTSGGVTAGQGVQCVFMSPPGVITPGQLCNPATSTGNTAPSGTLTANWTLTSGEPPGTYSVVLYDLSANQRLAQRQIALVGGGGGTGGTIALVPTGGNPSPNPAPAGTPGTVFAFDGGSSGTDASDISVTANASGLPPNDPMTEVISDPTGTVVFENTGTASAAGTLSFTWNFTQIFPALLPPNAAPSNYTSNSYTATFYDTNTNRTVAAAAFRILGYSTQTEFTNPVGTTLVVPKGGSTLTGLQFLNQGDAIFGVGNGDALHGIVFNTGKQGITITLGSGSTSCGTNCQQQTVTDSNGNSWTAVSVCTLNGANSGCILTITPVSSATVLPNGASISVPNVTFNNVPGNSNCTGTAPCYATTSELPVDGQTWSDPNDGFASNSVVITNNGGTNFAATGEVALIGMRDTNGRFHPNQEVHGYQPETNRAPAPPYPPPAPPRVTQALLDQNSPFAVAFNSGSGPWDVFALRFNNTSSGGGNVTELQVTMPTQFSPGNALTYVQIDPQTPSSWQYVACPTGAPQSAFCLATAGGNNGIPPGGSQTIYVDLAPEAPGSFAYTDWGLAAVKPASFPATADGTTTVFVPDTQSIDDLAMASYSVNGSLMNPLFQPTTVGVNTTPTITVSLQNTSTSADPFPDYLDAVVISLPSSYSLTNITPQTTGWIYLGSAAAGTNTNYWFGLCTTQFNTADGPVANPPPVNPPLPACTLAQEQNALAPGATFSFTATLGNLNSAGTINAIAYGHGANTDAWSLGHQFSLNVTSVAALAGFSADGPYGSPSTIPTNTEPQIGADSDPTYGNSFVYEIENTSGAGHNITSATITIPGTDTSGSNGTDSTGTNWTITSTPTITDPSGSKCVVTSYSSATTSGGNGAITIGGANCNLTPGNYILVNFSAKAPYKVNDTFQFPTTVNGNVQAGEMWFSDTDMLIVLTATLSIAVDPSNPGPGGSTPTVSCVGCTFNTSTNEIDFPNISNGQTLTFGDVARVSVYTNAASPVGWNLYVTTNNNPANNPGPPSNELLSDVDGPNSGLPGTVTVNASTQTVVPTSGSGTLLVSTSGTNAQRTPFDVIMNYQVSIQGGSTAAQTAVLTYTWISN
jgi:hypothetical protein